jgi:N-acetyl-gamma-glutamyl-phosphate reductase
LPEAGARGVPVQNLSELESWLPELDTVFLATPAEASLSLAARIRQASPRVDIIDLSGAFRLKAGASAYKDWYRLDHCEAELLAQADYGLAPFAAPLSVKEGRLVANPGCFATSVLMALVPLLKAGVVNPATLVIDSKSGSSGAGKKGAEHLLFTEVDGECLPYRVGRHQHLPEIREWAEQLSGVSIDPFFATHLLPVRRGILSSIYAELAPGKTAEDVTRAFASIYENYELVRFGAIEGKAGNVPARQQIQNAWGLSLKKVTGTARTHLQYTVEGKKLYLFSLIDNLLKGAASQAVENFNRLYDYPLALGLGDLEGTL